MTTPVEFGLDTFGDVTVDAGGRPHTAAQVIRDVVEQNVPRGRRRRGRSSGSASITARTSPSPPRTSSSRPLPLTRIRLGSAVTVLSSDDPIRVFQRFSTLDAISGGRAEITVGRGSFVESFPLFGYGLEDYEVLFSERLDLFAELLGNVR